MKRGIYLLLGSLILFSFIGCGRNNAIKGNENTKVAETKNVTTKKGDGDLAKGFEDSKLKTFYKNNFEKDRYSINQIDKVYSDGNLVDEIEMTVAVNGDKLACLIKSQSENQRFLLDGDKIFIIDDSNKKYFTMDKPDDMKGVVSSGGTFLLEGISDYDQKTFNNGVKELDGKEYYFEEYADEKLREIYYFEGEEVKWIESYFDESTRSVTELKSYKESVEDQWFVLESAYRKKLFPF